MRPKIDTSPNELYVNADGIEAINTRTPIITVIVVREIFHFSITAATIISYILNDEVNVANKNKIKNSAKKISPNGICENAAGNTINSNGGPLDTSKSNAKTTGKIASPAKNETKILNPTTEPAEFGKLTSFFKYELYVTKHEKPTASAKNDWPSAYKIDSPVIFEKSGYKKKN